MPDRINNPYQPPKAELEHRLSQTEREQQLGQQLVSAQSFLAAVFGALAGMVILLTFWVVFHLFNREPNAAMFFGFFGIVIGLAVRWAGRGLSIKYGILAVIATLLTVLLCMAIAPAGGIGMLFVLPSLAFAFISAIRKLDHEQDKALFRYLAQQDEQDPD